MHPRLPLSLKAALLASCIFCPFITSASVSDGSLGNVMYVGDSITHGINSGSYRWALHKIFADNGISYSAAGINTGNYSGGVAAGISYGGRVFNNAHSSQASARAYEIAGRADGANYGRFNGSNINNWLGLSTEKTKGGTYTGQTFTGTAAPGTFFILAGTNDLLSDGNNGTLNDRLSTVTQNLLGDMDSIVGAMKTANSNAEIIVLSIPCWTQHSNGNSNATHQAVADYNESLKNWGRDKDGVTVIDVNQGIIDVASSTPFYGVRSMFNNPAGDGLHPNAQGDLLMAGNLAKGMGYAGRSAGQERKAAHELGVNFGQTPAITQQELTAKGFTANNVTISNNTINFNKSGSSTLTYNWGASQGQDKGYTVDFTLRLGNGATGGWDTTNNFSLNLGNGTLNVNEAYIQWGSTILYSKDMSANADSIRVAYVAGDNAHGLSAGYYVWLGDVLIGEAQTAAGGSSSGLTFSYSGTLDAILSNLALDGSLSYAPSSSGITGPEAIYLAHGGASALKPGMIEWTTDTGATAVAPAGADNTYNVRNSANSNIAVITGTGSTRLIHANSGAYGTAENRQDLWVTLGEGVISDNGWIGGHTSDDLYGDINLRFAEGSIGKSTVFGTVNAGTVHGDIYLEFSSSTGNFDTSFTAGEADRTSVAGAYATAVNGDITMVFNDGIFSHRIFGGVYTGSKTISGSTSLYINGGTFMNEIYAGNKTQGTIAQGTSLTITGTNAILGKADGDNWAWTLLCGGNKTSGTINGGTTITLKDIAATAGDGSEHKFDKYAGTIDGKGGGTVNGEKKLVFDHYTAGFLGTLQNFDKVQVTGNSDLALDKALGDTVASLTVDAGSTLRFNQDQGATLEITNNGTIRTSHNLTLKSADTGAGTYRVEGGTLDLAGQAVSGNISICEGALANTAGLGAGSVSISGITGNISLGGLEGGKLGSINMGSGTGTISGLTGHADLSGSDTQLRLSAANMGAEGTGIIQFNNADGSSLTLGELTLTLTADAVARLTAPGDYAFHITNAALHADPNNITLSEYNGMAWDITRTEGGRVIISFGQLDAMVIDSNTVKNVTSAATLGATPSVTNNGTLNIDLSQGTAPQDKATTIRYLAGTEAAALLNTGTDHDVIITLLNETSADPDKPGNTAYAGSILGSAQLVKDGERRLTIDGRITASALNVQQGELVLQNTKESSIISGALNVEQDAALTLNSASLAAADLTGSGSITLAGGGPAHHRQGHAFGPDAQRGHLRDRHPEAGQLQSGSRHGQQSGRKRAAPSGRRRPAPAGRLHDRPGRPAPGAGKRHAPPGGKRTSGTGLQRRENLLLQGKHHRYGRHRPPWGRHADHPLLRERQCGRQPYPSGRPPRAGRQGSGGGGHHRLQGHLHRQQHPGRLRTGRHGGPLPDEQHHGQHALHGLQRQTLPGRQPQPEGGPARADRQQRRRGGGPGLRRIAGPHRQHGNRLAQRRCPLGGHPGGKRLHPHQRNLPVHQRQHLRPRLRGGLGYPASIHHQRPLCGKRPGHGGRGQLDGGHGEPDLCRLCQPRL
ncbi:GDSL-type esterase/lipase family protein [Akkermansia sp. RCC_12PD]|uniref:beta strand repeat-containing protein n=1 Tax=Akkermansia sp. RCC_12PD TaxID=3115152 RepID=UPI002EDB3FFE